MTLTNHILAAAAIAGTVASPFIALPLTLVSHFVLDTLPHFGYCGHRGYGEALKHRLARAVGGVDGILTAVISAFVL